MNEINKRLIIILNEMFKGNVSEFARISGIPQPTLNNIVGNRFSKPSSENLERLINSIDIIDANWLLTGKGEIMKNKQQIGDISSSTVVGANVNGNGNNITHNNFNEMIELQKGYQDLLRKKDDHISDLLMIIKNVTTYGK